MSHLGDRHPARTSRVIAERNGIYMSNIMNWDWAYKRVSLEHTIDITTHILSECMRARRVTVTCHTS